MILEEDKNLSVLAQRLLELKTCEKGLCVRKLIWEVMAGIWREGLRDGEEATMGVLLRSLTWAIWAQCPWELSEEPVEAFSKLST